MEKNKQMEDIDLVAHLYSSVFSDVIFHIIILIL